MECDGILSRKQVDTRLDSDEEKMLFRGYIEMSRSRYESLVGRLGNGWYRLDLNGGGGKNDDTERVSTVELLETSRTEGMQREQKR